MTVIMKNALFWDVALCGYCKNHGLGGKCRHHHQGENNEWTRNNVSSNNNCSTFFLVWSLRNNQLLRDSAEDRNRSSFWHVVFSIILNSRWWIKFRKPVILRATSLVANQCASGKRYFSSRQLYLAVGLYLLHIHPFQLKNIYSVDCFRLYSFVKIINTFV
jgi:hypothetical protein